MVGKAAAEDLLMSGEENRANSLLTVIKFIPVMTLTALFRIGTMGIGLSWAGIYIFIILNPLLTLPVVFVLFPAKCFGHLASLSYLEIVHAMTTETNITAIWGNVGREGSRSLQLGVGLYLLLVNTGLNILFMITDPSILFDKIIGDVSINNIFVRDSTPATLMWLGVTCICTGWLAMALFVWQIYYMEKYNIRSKLNTIAEMK